MFVFFRFQVALWYYTASLKAAESISGPPDPKIKRELYSSLGITYADIKEYDQALSYFEMELDICAETDTVAAIKCLREMIKNGKLGKISEKRIMEFAKRGLSIAQSAAHIPGQVQMLREKQRLQLESGNEELDQDCSPDSIARVMNKNFLTEIDLENVFKADDHGASIDGEDTDDIDLKAYCKESQVEAVSRRTKKLAVINNCGESRLHELVKSPGNLVAIQSFIEKEKLQSVDIYDYGNYTPLHEACNHGSLEYVKVLLQ